MIKSDGVDCGREENGREAPRRIYLFAAAWVAPGWAGSSVSQWAAHCGRASNAWETVRAAHGHGPKARLASGQALFQELQLFCSLDRWARLGAAGCWLNRADFFLLPALGHAAIGLQQPAWPAQRSSPASSLQPLASAPGTKSPASKSQARTLPLLPLAPLAVPRNTPPHYRLACAAYRDASKRPPARRATVPLAGPIVPGAGPLFFSCFVDRCPARSSPPSGTRLPVEQHCMIAAIMAVFRLRRHSFC
jgi:hypothetical protein